MPGLLLAIVLASPQGDAQSPASERLAFAPIADTYVEASNPDRNYDADARLRADADPERIIYLRFAVSGVSGRPVEQARLHLQVSGPSDDSGGTVHPLTDNTWDASTLTFNSRPAVGPAVDALGPVGDGDVVEFTLDGTITDDGVYCFAIASASADSVSYVSTAATSGQPPELVLRVATTGNPVVSIIQPPDGSTFFGGDLVPLQAAVTDDVDENLESELEWRSDRDGILGTGGNIAAVLSEGDHAVAASVTDSDGLSGSDQIDIAVVPPPVENTEPLVTITAPLDGQTFMSSEPVSFAGSATDLEDGLLTDALTWTSDQDGLIGQGGSFAAALSTGTHDVTASVTDSGGLAGLASVRFGVVAPSTSLEILPVADTYVEASNPGRNYDDDARLRADVDPERIIYLRFAVGGIGGRQVEQARLRLHVSGPSDESGGTIHKVTDNTWDASALTFDSRPPVGGPALDALGPVGDNDIVEFNLDGAIPEDGVYSFAIASTSGDSVSYASTAASSGQPPLLVLRLASTAAPVVTIVRPVDGSTFFHEDPVVLEAVVTDDLDQNLASVVEWRSDRDGALGTGGSISAGLSIGTHRITATATDSDSLTGEAAVTLVVRAPNAAPTVTITAPADGTTATEGTPLVLEATAIDDFDGVLSGAVIWTSSVDGNLGGGATQVATLREGTHAITASVIDTDGALGMAQVSVTVTPKPPNALPVVTITAPTDGDTVLTPFDLSGTATDLEDGDLAAAITWTSNIDGTLGTGASLTIASLSAATHTVTASVTDADGDIGSASITLIVGGDQTLTLTPDADTYVDSSAPDVAFGSHDVLRIDALPFNEAYVRFTVTGVAPFAVNEAILRLTVGPSSSNGSDSGGTVYAFTDNTWTEAVTFDTRPVVDGGPLATQGSVASGDVVDFDVTPALGADGTYSFAILTDSTNSVSYRSTDAAGGGPRLILRLKENTAPTVAITAPPSGTTVLPDAVVELVGIATDAEDGNISTQIRWRSDVQGSLGMGASVSFNPDPGLHTITAQVTDSSSKSHETSITINVGRPPTVTITSPADGTVLFATDLPLWLRGTATDAEDGNLSDLLQWTSNLDGFLGTGAIITVDLSVGTHAVTAAVTDADALTGTAAVTVVVRGPNIAPTVTITAPPDGTTIPAGTPLDLTATATDDFDGVLSDAVEWTSSVDGALGGGAALTVRLGDGTHTLTASARDSDGARGTAHISVTVTPTPPVVTVTAPAAGATVFHGEPLTFAGTAMDATDGDLSHDLTWTSNRDGSIGTGATFTTTTLTEGTHTVTAGVRDRSGLTAQAQVTVIVRPPNAPPAVTIVTPMDGELVLTPLTLRATAEDAEDGDVSATVEWTSSIDGIVGAGADTTVSHLSAGTHALTASATDADGGVGSATISVTARDGIVTVSPEADTYVDANTPDHACGAEEQLRADASPEREAYLRFALGDIRPFAVETATLRLTVGPQRSHGSKTGGTVHSMTDGTWSEATTTYTTRPLVDGPALDEHGAVTPDDEVDFDVTDAIFADGVYNFAIITGSSDAVGYRSREAATRTPRLILTLKRNTPPAITITAPAPGSVLLAETSVVFNATATDAEDGDLGADVEWSSDRDGNLGTGSTLTVPELSNGTHAITAAVTDSSGATRAATIEVTIERPPVVTITAPAEGAMFFTDDVVAFMGSAIDATDGNLSHLMTWTSNLDGPLGAGAHITTTLSAGSHTITATAADSHGLSHDATVDVLVDVNDPPAVMITMPPDTATFIHGTAITFAATASDPEEGEMSPHIAWTSDRDGLLGTGPLFTTTSPSVGTHAIRASVVDSRGLEGAAVITLIIEANDPPLITIAAPPNDSTAHMGEVVVFAGTAVDPEDGDLTESLTWSSDRDGLLGVGAGVSTASLSIGTHVVTATATDHLGIQGTATVTIAVVNDVPAVTIDAPADRTETFSGNPVTFIGSATDTEDGDLTAALRWRSSRDGLLGRGSGFMLTNLSTGTHTITATVTDGGGATGRRSITVTVQRIPSGTGVPTVIITEPADLTEAPSGVPLRLTAAATDPDDGDLSESVVWSSDLDGTLGVGAEVLVQTFSIGIHRITATATDRHGVTRFDQITLDIIQGAPIISILLPAPGTGFLTTTPVNFFAVAEDTVDGDVSGGLTWSSDLDGIIGTGQTFTVEDLSTGTHTVTASATNSRGITGTAEVHLVVSTRSVTLTPTADTYVDESLPDAAFGTGTKLEIDAGPSVREAYLRFDIASIDGLHVQQARLKLQVSDRGGSDLGGIIHTLSDHSWTEEDTTFATRPVVDGPAIATLDVPVEPDDVAEFDVTTAVEGNGTYAFAIVTPSSNAVKYKSRDASSGHPKLVLQLSQPHVEQIPDVTITGPTDGLSIFDDTPVTFTALATDAEDGDLSSSVEWASDLSGALGTGASLTVFLSRGTHVVSALVRDSFGLSARATVVVTIVDRPPTVRVSAPQDGWFFPSGFSVTFAGTAHDDMDGDIAAQLEWRSHRDGLIGRGASVTRATLSSGDHVVTATATNSLGTTSSATVTIFIDQAPPRVTIEAPVSESTAGEGRSITCIGSAIDVEDGDLSQVLEWSSDLEGPLGTGGTLPVTLTILGTHRITATATDSHGFTRSDEILVTVVPAPPTVTILAPGDGSSTIDAVTLSGEAIDLQDGDVTDELEWTSSLEGSLGTGPLLSEVQLIAGLHLITAAVTDDDGLLGSASIALAVGALPPVVEIVEPVGSDDPVSATTVGLGNAVTFTAGALDATGRDLGSDIGWGSDLDGQLGTGRSITISTLMLGRHIITAAVADQNGLTGSAQVVVNVDGGALTGPPMVTITAPEAGAAVVTGEAVTFTASAEDSRGTDLTDDLHWVSNLDGFLGTGGSVTTTLDTDGTHTVTATVADIMGAIGSDSIAITAMPASTSFPAVADTFIDEAQETANFGASPQLMVDEEPQRSIYLRFVVNGLAGRSIQRAVVRLQTTSDGIAASDHGGLLHPLENTTWDEMTLTKANAPEVEMPFLDAAGAVVPGQTVEFDVTPAVSGEGTYSFVVAPVSTDVAVYRSREAALGHPELVVFFEPAASQMPIVHITEPENRAMVPAGVPTQFQATADDAQDGDISIAIIWESDLDGRLAVGPSVALTLSPGAHVITASVSDVDGNWGMDLIRVMVGDAPTVQITSPASGAAVPFDEAIVVAGIASDPQDGDISALLTWSSESGGELGTGASLAVHLGPGSHTIIATVTDNDGNAASDRTRVTVPADNVGYEDFGFGRGVDEDTNRVTSAKPESKLWHTDGIWWGTLFNKTTDVYTIHRLDVATQTWVDTGVVIDERPLSRQDALVDGDTLYMTSRVIDPAGENRLLRFTYRAEVQTFALDPGFPISLSGAGTESLTLAKDSAGLLWIAYTLADQVFVSHTLGSDTEWAPPFVVPVADENPAAANVLFDDIAAVQALDGAIGVFWSNQITREDYFAVHQDGTPAMDPASWTLEVAASGGSVADDHMNLKLASDGRLFVSVKTSYSNPSSTLVGLLVRSPDGTWSDLHRVTTAEFKPTRPICLLDEVRRRIHVFYSPFEGAIFTKFSDMDDIEFPEPDGIGTPFITSSTTGFINNPTSTKQNVDPSTGLVVLAASKDSYWHNAMDPPAPPAVTIDDPMGDLVVRTGTTLTLAATAFSIADGILTDQLVWSSNLDGTIATGGIASARLSDGVHVITASVTDSTPATGSASVTVTVATDAAPVVSIQEPAGAKRILVGEPFVMSATAVDLFDGNLTVSLEWTSDRDGTIGSGGAITVATLSAGAHTITAQATDTAGFTGAASIAVDVQHPAPAIVTITVPAGDTSASFGAQVHFAGTAADAFDGDLTGSLRWYSDRDGAIGTGGSFSRSSLSRGVHTITASATDSHGLTGSATGTVTVGD